MRSSIPWRSRSWKHPAPTRAIPCEGVSPGHLEHARRIAAAQLDIIRIREVRQRLFDDPEARLKQSSTRDKLKNAIKILDWCERIEAMSDQVFQQNELAMAAFRDFEALISERDAPLPSLLEGIGNLIPKLLTLNRYERRATSRRKNAIRAYDLYCASQEPGGGGVPFGADEAAKSREESALTDGAGAKTPNSLATVR